VPVTPRRVPAVYDGKALADGDDARLRRRSGVSPEVDCGQTLTWASVRECPLRGAHRDK
jgi:hypothetical protein